MSQKTCDLLLTGGIVVTVNSGRQILDPGALAITGDRITAVGKPEELAEYTATRTIDCSGQVIIPGLIDCHNHLFQLLGRGLGEGMALWPWLCEFMWPYSANITSAEAIAGVRVGALEAVRSGTTCVVDNHYAPSDVETTLAVADAVEEVGLRGSIARGITGVMTPVARDNGLSNSLFKYSDDDEIAMTKTCIEQRADNAVKIWPAPLNIIYVGQDLVSASVELARSFDTKWHTHCSEAEMDARIYKEAYGSLPITWLHKEGLLGSDATIAHAIWLDDDEVNSVGSTGTGLSYNPQSNQYLSSGTMRLHDVRAAGAVVGMGTDGSAGHRADMFQVMKQAVYVQRQATLNPESCTAWEALELATREGAKYVGIDAGEISIGKLADLAIVDTRRPHLQPLHDVVSTLVYSCSGSDVSMTIVAGEVIYEDGRSTRVNDDDVMEECAGRARDLVVRAGFSSRLAEQRV